jgi:hypothetical protein
LFDRPKLTAGCSASGRRRSLHGFIVLTSSGRLVILTEDFIIYLHFHIHCSVVC